MPGFFYKTTAPLLLPDERELNLVQIRPAGRRGARRVAQLKSMGLPASAGA
jgi:hypothetical protein